MNDRAEMRGPGARERRTTISGGVKQQANGSKPPPCPGKKTDESARRLNSNGKVDREPGQQRADKQKKPKSPVDEISEGLR